MEKDKIINDILNEWAMRSPDGLVGGHDTSENMAILNEILDEYNKSKIRSGELDSKFFRYDSKSGKVLTRDHPLYDDGIDRQDIVNGTVSKKETSPTSNKGVTGASPKNVSAKGKPEWTEDYLINNKGFFPTSAKIILKALKELPNDKERAEFLGKFDRLSPEEAVNFLQAKGRVYGNFIDALDTARVSKGSGKEGDEGDASGSKAGRGEFILVLLIKGGTSAGSRSGDIILPDGRSIEVKEVADKGETFRATRASFGGEFNHIPFVDSLNELISFCVGNQEHIDALMELAIDAGVKNKSMPQKRDSAGQPIKLTNEDVPEGERLGELSALKKFLNTADINNLNGSTAYALAMLGVHVRTINERDAEKKIMDPDKVEFDIGKQTSVLKIDEIPPEDLAKVRKPANQPKEISVKVSSIAQDKRKAELIIPKIKRLKLFKSEQKSMKDVYTPENIAKTMFKAMSNPPGHYTGGIVFYNSKLEKFSYEPDLSNLKNGQYYFKSYQQTGPTFTKQKPKY